MNPGGTPDVRLLLQSKLKVYRCLIINFSFHAFIYTLTNKCECDYADLNVFTEERQEQSPHSKKVPGSIPRPAGSGCSYICSHNKNYFVSLAHLLLNNYRSIINTSTNIYSSPKQQRISEHQRLRITVVIIS